MKIDVLLGLQWGDEGKGKIVDVLAPTYQVVARFQGGPNAGHSLEFDNRKFVLHTIPSGIFHPHITNIIGSGVVLDPITFRQEVEALRLVGQDLKNLVISDRAHLILPTHRLIDAAQEAAKGTGKIGSTLRGIGPTYTDKISRNGLRVGDIKRPDFKERYQKIVKQHLELLQFYNFPSNVTELDDKWLDAIDFLRSFPIIHAEYFINNLLKEGKSILAEGAQGTLLDIDFGSYPFVTSSNTITAGACTGLGVPPSSIGKVYGVFKAYCTRVGSGPFPTELEDTTGEAIRAAGHEFGSTTGRPRRCGWLDLVALNYSVMVNGVTDLIITKSDVLNTFDKIHIATHYHTSEGKTDKLTFDLAQVENLEYVSFEGWKTELKFDSEYSDLPIQFRNFVEYIEKETGVKVKIISTGPDRTQTMIRP